MANPIISPRGKALYPWLNKADTKFKPEGEFKTYLICPDNDETQAFLAQCEAAFDEAYADECKKQKKPKLKKADMPWEHQEDGTVKIKFALKATIKSKKTGQEINRRVALKDGKGKPVDPKKVIVGTDSELKIAADLYFWFTPSLGFGLTLQPQAAKILKLVAPKAGEREYDFGDDEGDFDADEFSADDSQGEDAPWDEGEAGAPNGTSAEDF